MVEKRHREAQQQSPAGGRQQRWRGCLDGGCITDSNPERRLSGRTLDTHRPPKRPVGAEESALARCTVTSTAADLPALALSQARRTSDQSGSWLV
ncbi:hypothetical protein AOLI_G00314540 [Acnodon oligacanthus]